MQSLSAGYDFDPTHKQLPRETFSDKLNSFEYSPIWERDTGGTDDTAK